MGQRGLSKRFTATYNNLDEYLRKEARADTYTSHTELFRKAKDSNAFIRIHFDKLRQFADLRNAIVHSPRQDADPIAEPHKIVVEEYEELFAKLVNPPLALEEMAVKEREIYKATLDTTVLDVLNQMYQNDFTNVPVFDEGKLFGVFSENSLFSYAVKEKGILFTEEEELREFKKYLPLESHLSERFEFISRESTVYDVQVLFQKEIQNSKRIAAAFITHSGKETEKILGMITPWDVASYSYD